MRKQSLGVSLSTPDEASLCHFQIGYCWPPIAKIKASAVHRPHKDEIHLFHERQVRPKSQSVLDHAS